MGAMTQDLSLCLQLLVQPEENLLCTMSTQLDLQQLPYIWALVLLCQPYIFGRVFNLACMLTY